MSRRKCVTIAGFAVAAAYLAKAMYRGLAFTQGDFYFTMPGEYAERLNAVLWTSPDIQGALEFNNGAYLYGPTQYLTLFPIVFLDSYRSIASLLLIVYPVVLIAACWMLSKLVTAGESRPSWLLGAIFALMFAFLPVTQAIIQREFEVVTFLVLVAACLLLARGHEGWSGAAVAYLTWFKYWPVVFLASFVVHRRFKGLAAFGVATAVLFLSAQLAFGLQHFGLGRTAEIVRGLVRPLGSGEVLYPVIGRGALKSDFCRQWVGGRGTASDVRWALCSVEDRWPFVPAKTIFYTLVVATATLFAWAAMVLHRRRGDAVVAKWSTIWEFSILAIGGAAFIHAHYYYFIVFLLPLAALLHWFTTQPQAWRKTKIAVWCATYLLLNAFMLPMSWLSAMLRQDAWVWYLDSGLCLLGIVLLLSLVLWEFTQLTVRAPRAVAAV